MVGAGTRRTNYRFRVRHRGVTVEFQLRNHLETISTRIRTSYELISLDDKHHAKSTSWVALKPTVAIVANVTFSPDIRARLSSCQRRSV